MSTVLASPPCCPQNEDMGEREDAVRRAVELHTGSLRALAREAQISPRLLRMIVSGDRTATPRTVERLAGAMERLQEIHAEALLVLKESIQEREEDT